MDLVTLLELCQDYRDMGDAVQEQLHAVADGEDLDELNNNALAIIKNFLRLCVCREVDRAEDELDRITEYLRAE